MELTGKKLEEVVNTELVGKDVGYSIYSFAAVALKIVRLLVKEVSLNENDFSYKQEGSTNSIYLTYKNVSFGDVTFQKQKGKYRYGHYDWTFKKVFVNLWNEDGYSNYKGLTFLEMISKIDEELDVKKTREQAKLEQAKQIFQKIKEEIGAKDDYEVRSFIEYMNKNRYSISD